jgi:hypothetical protein
MDPENRFVLKGVGEIKISMGNYLEAVYYFNQGRF